jgi:hypothetical protein
MQVPRRLRNRIRNLKNRVSQSMRAARGAFDPTRSRFAAQVSAGNASRSSYSTDTMVI